MEQRFYFCLAHLRLMKCRESGSLPVGTAPSSSSISCSTKLQQPKSASCFEKRLHSATQVLCHLFHLMNALFPAEPASKTLVQMKRGVPNKFSSSISRRMFQISLKKIYLKISIHQSCSKPDLHSRELDSFALDASSSWAFLHSPSSFAKRSQVSFHVGLKPLCPVCSTIHSHTVRYV